MKRKIGQESETSKKTKGSVDDNLVWELVVGKLGYITRMKLSQVSHRLNIVDQYAEHKLQKVQRRLQEDKYL